MDNVPTLTDELEAAINTVDSVMHGLQEIADSTSARHAMWAFSNALQAAQPALEKALDIVEKAQENLGHLFEPKE